jgi:peptidoglycan/LPS O-acetylase OafA/YrhL
MNQMDSMKQRNANKLSYRTEIDGLRALAVVSVIFYHAKLDLLGRNLFEGGFIGVDIFFVISGYLITRIILSELYSKGSFSFINFYERRARRILPMLFIVIFVSIPYAWQKLVPADFVEYAESILPSLFFGSNIFFYFSTTEYGADSALLKPFLHTWSLGVEEQFYLVFPILAILAFKYFRNHFLTILVALSLLSLQFSELMELRNSDFNYYLPFSRFWELAVGSILAYRELNYKPSDDGFSKSVLPMLGLYLVSYSILFFNSKTPHPSFHTLIPIIGVSLIIRFASKDELVGKLLGSKPFVWIGLLSYSAYLWHFPIMAFSRQTSLVSSTYDKFGWIILTFVLSVISFFVIERPFRLKNVIRKRELIIFLFSSSLLTIVISALIMNGVINSNGKREGFDDEVSRLLDNAAFRNESVTFEVNYDYSVKNNGKNNLLVVGNSHAEDLLKALSFSYLKDSFNLNLVSPKKRSKDVNYQVRCLLVFLDKKDTSCTQTAPQGAVEYGPNIIEQYATADIILLASRWGQRDIDSVPNIIRKALKDGKKIIVVSNTPQSETFGEKKYNRFDKFLIENKRMELLTISQLNGLEFQFYADYLKKQKSINKKLKAIVDSFSDDRVVYKERSDYMCDSSEQRCYLYFPKDKAKVLYDDVHTTIDGARVLGRLITERRWLADFVL